MTLLFTRDLASIDRGSGQKRLGGGSSQERWVVEPNFPTCRLPRKGSLVGVVHRMTPVYAGDVGEVLSWDDASAAYIRARGERYVGGSGIEPEWAQQVLDDVDLVSFEPDPKSRMGASRFIGFSADAQRVLVVIAFRDADGDLHGINAWPATGADLRFYREGTSHGEDD